MANRIFTNGEEGKILTSVGNRIIKQPYEFGNAFQNRMGLNNYIKISGLSLPVATYTYSWHRDGGFIANGTFLPMANYKNTSNDNIAILLFQQTSTYGNYYSVKNSSIGNTGITSLDSLTQYNRLRLSSVIFRDNNLGQCNYDLNTNELPVAKGTNALPYNEIWISAYRNSNGATPTAYNISSIFNRFIVSNRELPYNERVFLFSNRLGSDLQSSNGVVIDLYCDFAEILDFSVLQNGSDMRVGCRDYSGFNRHGEIMNLPAGTLEYKRDYANANLFVTFLI